jgi:hypothetical protein
MTRNRAVVLQRKGQSCPAIDLVFKAPEVTDGGVDHNRARTTGMTTDPTRRDQSNWVAGYSSLQRRSVGQEE